MILAWQQRVRRALIIYSSMHLNSQLKNNLSCETPDPDSEVRKLPYGWRRIPSTPSSGDQIHEPSESDE